MAAEIRVRFAPSPTGYLHIGGARTAMFNWLFARHHGGKFVLRIEDTDTKRNTEEAMAAIYEGLEWLGLNWDEGPQVDGDFGPYLQSERTELYERYLKKLQDAGHIFEDQGALRFRSPREHVIVDDIVCGKIDFDLSNPATHPDMTIRRPDGSWIFHFVNVIDDLEMKISHVIRGEDHLSNTPKHIEIIRALGATPPHYAHIPLILNRDGTKMSKRDEGARVSSYIEQGYVPEAVRNYLCLLGWSPKDNREKIDIDEVIKMFELDDLNRGNSAFDLNKCVWLNDQYIAQMSLDRFIELARPFLEKTGMNISDEKYFRAVMSVVKEKIKLLGDVPETIRSTEDSRQLGTSGYSGYSGRVTRGYSGSGVSGYSGYFFTEDYEFDPTAVGKVLKKPFALENLSALRSAFAALEKWDAQSLEITLKMLAGVRKVKTGDLVHPALKIRFACRRSDAKEAGEAECSQYEAANLCNEHPFASR